MVNIDINNGRTTLQVEPGRPLLATLAAENLFMPSACGGNGICSTCKCQVPAGGGDLQPAELRLLKKPEQERGTRLACQVPVRENMSVILPSFAFDARRWPCTVVSNRNVATFIKELVLALPAGEPLCFRPGGYIQIDIPPHNIPFTAFDIPETYRGDWEKMNFMKLSSVATAPTFRAYSMANHPAEGNHIILNVRISTPPGGPGAPPGIASSYLFSLRPGDPLTVTGPFGDFFIKETEREMVYIGGGAGMAPLRSHLFHLFHTQHTQRKVTFWYGARSRREIFYEDDFRAIAHKNPNFSFNIALSEPQPEDQWSGPVGLIHQVVLNQYLAQHPTPAEIEYYLCGPPMMIRAVTKMLTTLGVKPDMIVFDQF